MRILYIFISSLLMMSAYAASEVDEEKVRERYIKKFRKELITATREWTQGGVLRVLGKFRGIMDETYEIRRSGYMDLEWDPLDPDECEVSSYSKKDMRKALKPAKDADAILEAINYINSVVCVKDYSETDEEWWNLSWVAANDLMDSFRFGVPELISWFKGEKTLTQKAKDGAHSVYSVSVKLFRWIGIMSPPSTSERIQEIMGGVSLLYIIVIVLVGVFIRRYSGSLGNAFVAYLLPPLAGVQLLTAACMELANSQFKMEYFFGLVAMLTGGLWILDIVEIQVVYVGAFLFIGIHFIKIAHGISEYSKDNPFKGLLFITALVLVICVGNAIYRGDLKEAKINLNLGEVKLDRDTPDHDKLLAKSSMVWCIAVGALGMLAIAGASMSSEYRRGVLEGAAARLKSPGQISNQIYKVFGVEYLLIVKQPIFWAIVGIPTVSFIVHGPVGFIVYGAGSVVGCLVAYALYAWVLKDNLRAEGCESVAIHESFFNHDPAMATGRNVATATMQKVRVILCLSFLLMVTLDAHLTFGGGWLWIGMSFSVAGFIAYSSDKAALLHALCVATVVGMATPMTITSTVTSVLFLLIMRHQEILKWSDRGVRDITEHISTTAVNIGETGSESESLR